MIRTTPFHERTSALNETGLWEHWANHLAASKYQMSEKFEYVAVRNAVGVFDTSPLYKYRISGPDAECFLAGVLARDPRALAPGRAQYTLWCDDRGYMIEDGILLRRRPDEFLLTAAEPNLGYFRDLVVRQDVQIDEVSDDFGVMAIQGPNSRAVLGAVVPAVEKLGYFDLVEAKVGKAPIIVSRTGYTGDLGYEVWVPSSEAIPVWDAVWQAGQGRGITAFGLTALYMARIEAGLVLLDVDFESSRFAWTDAHRTTPIELGFGWMFGDIATTDRAFIGRDAIRREIAGKTSRWKLMGLILDWQDYDRHYNQAGLIPPKDHTPIQDEYYIYDEDDRQVGWASSLMYSPMLQRHIALARLPLARAKPGSHVRLEFAVSHRYEYFDAVVAKLPLFDPPRRTA
jgi:aminomethyltransferase